MLFLIIICNHSPQPSGDGRGNERDFDQSVATAMRRKFPGLLYIGKKGREMKKIAGCGGKTAVVLPTSSLRRLGLLAEFAGLKVKVPTIPRVWGPWLPMTSALCNK